MGKIALIVTVLVKLFALGLVVRAAVTWFRIKNSKKVEDYLDRLYAPCLAPIRKILKPIQFNTSPPTALDVSPLVLLCLVWWIIHPFLMWLLA